MLKLIEYDIRNGIRYVYKKIIMYAAFVAIMLIYNHYAIVNSFGANVDISIGDYLIYMFKGAKQFDIASLDIPIFFLGNQMFIAIMVGYYAVDDIHGFGRQVFIRCCKKSYWWYSKCTWILCTVLVSYALLYLIVFAVGICMGANMSLNVNDMIVMFFDRVSLMNIDNWELVIYMFVTPLLASLAMSIAQVAISLIIGPLLSFIIVIMYGILSVLITNPILFYNHTMVLRNYKITNENITCSKGMIYMIVVCVICIISGRFIVDRKDISI